MAASLPQPGVEVIQQFSATTPTVITPTLVPCIVGVCRQEVDVLTTNAAGAQVLNSEAQVPLQAALVAVPAVGTPPVYAGLDGLDLVLSLGNGPPLTIEFAGTPLSPAQVVATIQAVFAANSIVNYIVEAVGTTQWRIRSTAADDFQTIVVVTGTDPAVLAAFGFSVGREYTGASFYTQDITPILIESFPDPNNNIAEIVVEPDTVRVFLFLGGAGLGSALLEVTQTSAFLQNGIGTQATITGDVALTAITYATYATVTGDTDVTSGLLYGGGGTLDGTTLILNVNGAGALTLDLVGTGNAASESTLLAAIAVEWPAIDPTVVATFLTLTDLVPGAAGSITVGGGTANTALGLSTGPHVGVAGELDGETVLISLNGATPLTITFGVPLSIGDILSTFTSSLGALATATELPTSHFLQLQNVSYGADYSLQLTGGTALTNLGLTAGAPVLGIAGVQALNAGSGSAVTTILNFPGVNFTAAPGSASIVGTVALTVVTDGLTLELDDGTGPQTLSFLGASTPTLIKAQINALFGEAAGGQTIATTNGSGDLVLTSTQLGAESILTIIGGTALTVLGLVTAQAAGTVTGAPYQPLPGDTITVDGTAYATIVKVAPGGVTSQLQISTQVPVSNDVGNAWYITANGLSIDNANTGVTRPIPNLTVDDIGDATIKANVLRDIQGNPVATARAQFYVQYRALRLDVTAQAANAGLLSFGDTTTLATNLSPITSDNPLGLGFYFALLNAPGIAVTGIGVDEESEGSPFGTLDGFTRAAQFLESYEVYGIAPLTHDPTIFQVFNTHVTLMSGPEQKGERIVLINPTIPTTYVDTLVASGTDGNTTLTANQFDTGIAGLDSLLVAQGESGTGPYSVTAGIYLDIGDGNHYSVVNVVGSVLSIQTSGFLPGQNDDGYYATTPLPTPLISEPFALRIRGAALLLPDGMPDYDNIALTVQEIAQGYANRRVWSTFPDMCSATINGVQQQLDGFYLNAAIVGMIGAQPPQQSFTNFPMTGFTSVIGSTGTFSQSQMNIMAAGGNYIIIQDSPGTPLYSRMALTTDMTSVETRTDSVTKIVDFVAKFLRTGLKNYIGRFNITQGFLDSLGHVIAGLLGFLTDSGVLIGASLNNLVQDTTEPDQVDVDITLDVPLPCNYIRLTLTI
jgi:hypothetical protein